MDHIYIYTYIYIYVVKNIHTFHVPKLFGPRSPAFVYSSVSIVSTCGGSASPCLGGMGAWDSMGISWDFTGKNGGFTRENRQK
jgi:hypothetical protein